MSNALYRTSRSQWHMRMRGKSGCRLKAGTTILLNKLQAVVIHSLITSYINYITLSMARHVGDWSRWPLLVCCCHIENAWNWLAIRQTVRIRCRTTCHTPRTAPKGLLKLWATTLANHQNGWKTSPGLIMWRLRHATSFFLRNMTVCG